MNPVIRHLQKIGLDATFSDIQIPMNWTFSEKIKKLGPDFYRKIIPLHPILQFEYSILCAQLSHNLLSLNHKNKDKIKQELIAALMLAELLEHINLHYLNVPREVKQFRKQQTVYREMLTELGEFTFFSDSPELPPIKVNLSFSQRIRDMTANSNWYRLFFSRCKRVLSILVLFQSCSEPYRDFISAIDQYANPFLAYLSWCFFLPRLLVNLFLLFKHIIPGSWMNEEEISLGWMVRLQAQLQRRWFELGNDLAWVTVGLINCFILTGALAPIGVYLTIVFFAYDVILASIRACIELNRLHYLDQEFSKMLKDEKNEENLKEIKEYREHLNHRMNFEILRLSIHVVATTAVFLAMCFAIPAFAANPAIPLVGAILLVAISLLTFVLTRLVEQYRPKDNVHKPSNVVSLGIFAKKHNEKSQSNLTLNDGLENTF